MSYCHRHPKMVRSLCTVNNQLRKGKPDNSIVVELWNGSGIVRVLGVADVVQIVYFDGTVDRSSDNEDSQHTGIELQSLIETPKGNLEMYDFNDAVERGILVPAAESRIIPGAFIGYLNRVFPLQVLRSIIARFRKVGEDAAPPSTPNISLNIGGQRSSSVERWGIAIFGVALQLGVITYAAAGVLGHTLSLDFMKDNDQRNYRYAFPMMAGGTTTLVIGMYLCACIIDGSTSETNWLVPQTEKRQLRITLLQRGMGTLFLLTG